MYLNNDYDDTKSNEEVLENPSTIDKSLTDCDLEEVGYQEVALTTEEAPLIREPEIVDADAISLPDAQTDSFSNADSVTLLEDGKTSENTTDKMSVDENADETATKKETTPQPDNDQAATTPSTFETAKLFGVSEEKLTAEFNAYKAAKLFRRVNLFAVGAKIGVEEIKGFIKSGIELGLESVTVLPEYICEAKKVAGDKIKLRVAVSYPFGGDLIKHKLKQIGAFSRMGLSGIELPIPLKDLSQKKSKQIIKEWKKYIKKAGKTAIIMVTDFDLLSVHEIKTVCEIAKELNVKLKTSTCVLSSGGFDFQEDGLSCLDNLRYEIASCAPSAKDILSTFLWGADTVSSPNVISAIKDIKKLLGCE